MEEHWLTKEKVSTNIPVLMLAERREKRSVTTSWSQMRAIASSMLEHANTSSQTISLSSTKQSISQDTTTKDSMVFQRMIVKKPAYKQQHSAVNPLIIFPKISGVTCQIRIKQVLLCLVIMVTFQTGRLINLEIQGYLKFISTTSSWHQKTKNANFRQQKLDHG